MTRKILSLVLCVLLMVSVFGFAATASEGKTDLRLFFWYGAEDLPYWQESFDRYMAANPDVNVVVEISPWQDYWTKLQTQVASQSQADVFGMVSMYSDFYIQGGALLGLTPFMDDKTFMEDYWPAMMQAYTWNDEVYCLPYDLSTEMLLVNLDIFEDAGVEFKPEGYTKEEFEEICAKITNADRYALNVVPTDWAFYDICTRAGIELLDADGKLNLNQPAVVEILQWYADLQVAKGYGAPYAYGQDLGYFDSGKVAMTNVNPEWVMRRRERQPNAKLDVMPYPTDVEGGKAVMEGGAYCASAHTKIPEQAFGLLKELTSPQTLGDIVGKSHRGIPGNEGAKDVMLESKYAVPHSDGFLKLLDNYTRVNFPKRTEVEVELRRQMDLVWTGEATAEAALADFQTEANLIMSE